MTTIQANITISGTTTPLDGFIRVLTQIAFSFDDTLTVPVIKDFPLVAGEVEFDLEPSDIARVSYQFEIYQNLPDLIDEEENSFSQPPALIKTFHAVVPFSDTPISFTQLAEQASVRYDAQDAALLTLSRFLYSSDTFWDTMVSQVFSNRGEWNNTEFYKRGDVVTYNGSGYQYISQIASQGNLPTNLNFWRLLVAKGDPGTGLSGSMEPYGSGWSGATEAPAKAPLYDYLQTLATQAALDLKVSAEDAALTGNPTAPTQAIGNNTTRIANTSFVSTAINRVGKIPVGGVVMVPFTAAPANFRLLQVTGQVLSQASFPDLFTAIGTVFNTGGEGTGNFRLPAAATNPFSSSNWRYAIYVGNEVI